jgi:Two component regulator propeller
MQRLLLNFSSFLFTFNVICFTTYSQFTFLPNPLGSTKAANSRTINAIQCRSDGSLYFGTNWNEISSISNSSKNGLFIFNNGSWKAIQFDNSKDEFEQIFNLKLSPDNNKIAFTRAKGTINAINLSYFEIGNNFSFTNLLVTKPVSGVYSDIGFDKDYDLWFSQEAVNFRDTRPNGYLGYFKNGSYGFTKYDRSIESFKLGSNNNVFLKTNGTIIRNYAFDANENETLTDKADTFVEINADNSVFYCAYRSLYASSNGSPNKLSDLPDELGQNDESQINCSYVDNNKNYYLGTRKGLYIFSNNEWLKFNNTNSNLLQNNITAIGSDEKGNIWLAGDNREWNSTPENLKVFICYFKPSY